MFSSSSLTAFLVSVLIVQAVALPQLGIKSSGNANSGNGRIHSGNGVGGTNNGNNNGWLNNYHRPIQEPSHLGGDILVVIVIAIVEPPDPIPTVVVDINAVSHPVDAVSAALFSSVVISSIIGFFGGSRLLNGTVY
ncbi:hypothetical protein CVT25_010433 [Psilocybe cyanescens]|uniref:Uncharacterized protein n=1 Tax=Psilocybe cyanescens TaxID=93625 RepID=A0A409XP06_PSICY|nr:hypothetical protein CVT25_010433 [Psilocybe cyanescens]